MPLLKTTAYRSAEKTYLNELTKMYNMVKKSKYMTQKEKTNKLNNLKKVYTKIIRQSGSKYIPNNNFLINL
jgi:hypothetical protein